MTTLFASMGWTAPSGAALLAALLLAAALAHVLWRVRRRLAARSRVRWLLVSLLNLGSAAALFALLAPPSLPGQPERGIVLLTEGARPEEVIGGGRPFSLADAGAAVGKASLLLHPGQLPLRESSIADVRLLGYGLDADAWAAIPAEARISFRPPPLEGLVESSWPRRVRIGEPLTIEGKLQSESGKVLDLDLLDPAGGVVGTTSLRGGDRWSFVTRARAPGLLEYGLRLRDGEATLAEEAVRLEAIRPRPARLRVLQSAPGFEARQLRHWAGDRGARVIVESQVSRDRSIARGVNLGAGERLEGSLTESDLAGDDLLVMDGRRWTTLEEMERAAVARAVRAGLGLLVLADAELARFMEQRAHPLLTPLSLEADTEAAEPLPPVLPETGSELALPTAPWRILPAGGQVLLRDRAGAVLEAWHDVGLGRVALSRLRERHGWVTAGETGSYSAYWDRLLQVLGRPAEPPYLLPPDPGDFARANRVRPVCILASDETTVLAVESVPRGASPPLTLEPAASVLGGPRRCAWFWPGAAGWHRYTLRSESGAVLDSRHEYVHGEQEWATLERHRRVQASNARAAAEAGAAGETAALPEPLSPRWPWLLFLACAVPLWVERRLDAGA